jgi:hypothetical protein
MSNPEQMPSRITKAWTNPRPASLAANPMLPAQPKKCVHPNNILIFKRTKNFEDPSSKP